MGVRLYVHNVTLVLERLPDEATGPGKNSLWDDLSNVISMVKSDFEC